MAAENSALFASQKLCVCVCVCVYIYIYIYIYILGTQFLINAII